MLALPYIEWVNIQFNATEDLNINLSPRRKARKENIIK